VFDLSVAFIIGIFVGISFAEWINQRKQPVQEEPSGDLLYYKNLSDSLMNDVRQLRSENRKLKGLE
jgi:hypothetical protein